MSIYLDIYIYDYLDAGGVELAQVGFNLIDR